MPLLLQLDNLLPALQLQHNDAAAAAQQAAAQQATQVVQQLAAPQQPTVPPYKGVELPNNKNGSTLFFEACKPLHTTFTGKVEDLPLFLADLKECAAMCCWNKGNHDILTINLNNKALKLLDNYGITMENVVEDAASNRQATGTVRAKQNALMMHNCIYTSISDKAKSKLVATMQAQDGPTTFHTIDLCCHLHPCSVNEKHLANNQPCAVWVWYYQA